MNIHTYPHGKMNFRNQGLLFICCNSKKLVRVPKSKLDATEAIYQTPCMQYP